MISLLVVQHDIVAVFPFFDRVFLLNRGFLLFLMLLDNLFDLFLKLDNGASDLGCELLDAAGDKDHQDQSHDQEWGHEEFENLVGHTVVDLI